MEDAEAEFAVAQSVEMAQQHAILESIQDEAHVETNWLFIQQDRAMIRAVFAQLNAEAEADVKAALAPEQ
ncbi:hypothetical protein D1007_61158 [Hordeum vulgare]|nr:hypothetical protein D1007_61158 [Hordeum vulgare]